MNHILRKNYRKLFGCLVMKQIPRRSWDPVQTVTDSDLAEHPLLMMRREVFIRVGGENELIPRGLDPYLRLKFRQQGFRVVVVPGAYYSYLPPITLPKLIKHFTVTVSKRPFATNSIHNG